MKKRVGFISIVLIIITIILFYIISNSNFSLHLKADISHGNIHGALFDVGYRVNEKIKNLAGNPNSNYATNDNNVIRIRRSNNLTITPTEENTVSISTSEIPIFMWYDNETIYWYSEDENPKLNPNSDYMFSNFRSLETIDELRNFDTSNVTSMFGMFKDCSSLTTLDLSNFNTNSVTSMGCMFAGCSSLTTLSLNSFNTSKVESMNSMFSSCDSLTTLYLSSFDTRNVTTMFSMFINCSSLTTLNLNSFNTEKVTDMSSMFAGCSSLTTLNLNNFNTSNVTNMRAMLYDCSSLTTLDLNNFDTGKVIDMSSMFGGCSSLTALNLSSFNTNSVKNMWGMFNDCRNLTSLDLGDKFETSKVTNMGDMFHGCSLLTTLDLNNFDTGKVTNMSFMFADCSLLTNLNINSFNTSNVTNMGSMFLGCGRLQSLNLSNFNTSKVVIMEEMFRNCSNLEIIYASNSFVTTSITNSTSMFYNNLKLKGDKGTVFDSNYVDKTYARLDGGISNPGYFSERPKSDDTSLKSILVNSNEVDLKSLKIDVASNVEKATIEAKTTDSKATVSGDLGEKKLSHGENKFSITVKAESGVSRTYTLIVNRKRNDDKKNNVTPSSDSSETTCILTSDIYKIDNDKQTINGVDKNHSDVTIFNNVKTTCGTITVGNEKVTLKYDGGAKEYSINRVFIVQTGQNVIKYSLIIVIIYSIIGLLLFVTIKNKNNK